MKILVIDDDKAITQMLSDYYKEKGETCKVCNKGTEGLKAMRNDSFDVVLMDLNMPDFTGFDLLRTFAYGGLLKQKNAIIITAMDIPPEQEKQMINAGVVGIIRKPFSLSTLDNVVSRFRK